MLERLSPPLTGPRLLILQIAFLVLLSISLSTYAHSERYYDMVQSLINERDYYAVLEVERTADDKEIRRAFLKKMMKLYLFPIIL